MYHANSNEKEDVNYITMKQSRLQMISITEDVFPGAKEDNLSRRNNNLNCA